MDWTIHWPELLWRELALSPPADLAAVSDWLGVSVKMRDWSPAIAGVYLVVPGGKAVIGLNANMPPGRISFTWAHELGHHLGGHHEAGGLVIDCPDGDSRAAQDAPERECDAFAANLLMPEAVFRNVWTFLADRDLRDRLSAMDATFGVSRSAVLCRMEELGIAIGEHAGSARATLLSSRASR